MSHRRKHVRSQRTDLAPTLSEGEEVCRVVDIRGGNQVEVLRPDGECTQTLIRVPSKFSRVLWMRKGTYVVSRFVGVDPDAAESNVAIGKVTGELVRVLYADQIREMRKMTTGSSSWPAAFDAVAVEEEVGDEDNAPDEDEEGDEVEEEDVVADRLGRLNVSEEATQGGGAVDDESEEEESEDDGLPPLEANTNWKPLCIEFSDDDDESDDD